MQSMSTDGCANWNQSGIAEMKHGPITTTTTADVVFLQRSKRM